MNVDVCPGCAGATFAVEGRNQPAPTIPAKKFVQPAFEIRRCLECGLYYKSAVLDAGQLQQLYSEFDFSVWESGVLYPPEKLTLQILRQLPPRSRILDFGCSSGRLLANLSGDFERFGLEINEKAAHVAASRGIRIVTGDDINTGEAGLFDAIILSDVVEHLPQPTQTLAWLRGKLRPGGELIIMTGNADAPACRQDIASFWYFASEQHLCMISRRYAEFVCAELNLGLSRWATLSHYDTPLRERVWQRARNFAYWAFHGPKPSPWRFPLSLVPLLRRARYWKFPPMFNCTRDHVVAVLRDAGPVVRRGES